MICCSGKNNCSCKKSPRKITLLEERVEKVPVRFIDLVVFKSREFKQYLINVCKSKDDRELIQMVRKNSPENVKYSNLPLAGIRY